LLASLMLAACASDKPDTYFDWGMQDAAQSAASTDDDVKPQVRPGSRRHYVYGGNKDSTAGDAQPKARPTTPAWYSDANPGYANNCGNPKPRTAPVDAAANAPAKTAAVDGKMRFVWPLRGQVLDDFGAAKGGERNDGINIAVNYETPIHASAAGKVSYVGNDIKSYGNLVLIRHEGNYITAYAHADRLTVKTGDYVQAGQIIGYAGTSGDVSRPQLHFEIRRGTTPLNPRSLLS
jgi:murein DD-endopeptidase MepM/ murein hydrolase activator NlpD